jgi:hypothetical protein
MRKNARLGLFCVLLFLAGCAAPPTIIWTSNPEIQTMRNQYYEARLQPLTSEQGPFYDSFRLVIVNKTDRNLKIDWNNTRYVQSGKRFGGFVWIGIEPQQYRDSSLPPDIVPPKGIFKKVIFPFKKLTFAPGYRRGDRLGAGSIPEGESGIDLVVGQNGKKVRQRITVNIVKEVK